MKRFCKNALGLTERQLWGDTKEQPITKKQLARLKAWPVYAEGGKKEFSNPPKGWSPNTPIAQERTVRTPLADHLLLACGRELLANDSMVATIEGQIRMWLKDLLINNKRITPRLLLQTFGTEFGRKHLQDDFWIRVGLHSARHLLDGWAYDRMQGLAKRHGGSDAVVITDCRFRNEVLAIKRAGGRVYRIVREPDSKDRHASEAEQFAIPNWWCDDVIPNDASKEAFESKVRSVASKVMRKMFFPDPRFRKAP
jgi:hypothetical protein